MSHAKDSDPRGGNLKCRPARATALPVCSSQSMRASAPQRNEKKQEYANIFQSFLPFYGFPPYFFPEQACKTTVSGPCGGNLIAY